MYNDKIYTESFLDLTVAKKACMVLPIRNCEVETNFPGVVSVMAPAELQVNLTPGRNIVTPKYVREQDKGRRRWMNMDNAS